MRYSARHSTWRLAGMLLLLWLTLLPVGAQSDQLHEAYARYQGAYRSYQEAVQAGKARPEIDRLAAALKTAQAQYVNLLNKDAGQDSSAAGEALDEGAVARDDEDIGDREAAPSAAVPDQRSRVVRSAEEQEYDSLMGDLYTPDRKKRGPELLAKVRAFLKKVKNPLLKMYATFGLAKLELDLTNDPKRAAVILEAYAVQAPTKEAARLARAKIKVFQQEVVVQKFRGAFGQQVEATKSSWQVFKKTSWLALPVKIVRLASYGVKNIVRRARGRTLKKELETYDALVRDALPRHTLDSFTNSQLIPCNTISLLVNGRTSFARRFALAREAQEYICLQTLLYYDDETGNELADILIERAQAGVEVKVIVDDAFAFTRRSSIMRRLQNGGVSVLFNNPLLSRPWMFNFRSHQKMFIVDNEVAIVGGMNIAQEYAKGEIKEWGWRDTDIEIRGPAVPAIVDLFDRNWESLTIAKWYERGDPDEKQVKKKEEKIPILPKRADLLPGPLPIYFQNPPTFQNVRVRFLTTFPVENDDDDILDLFRAYLQAAKTEVFFESAYFIPRPELVESIVQACRRGVRVRIITNSIESNNHPNAGYAGRANYEDVLRAGAEIYEWRGAQTLHSKVSLFDDLALTVGAYNMNSRSHSCDSEDVLAIEDRRVAAVFRTVLAKDLARCRQITLEEALSWRKDFMERMKIDFFNLFKAVF